MVPTMHACKYLFIYNQIVHGVQHKKKHKHTEKNNPSISNNRVDHLNLYNNV